MTRTPEAGVYLLLISSVLSQMTRHQGQSELEAYREYSRRGFVIKRPVEH